MAKVGGGKSSADLADKLRAGLTADAKQALRSAQADAVEEALYDWVQMQSSENSARLYTAALNYFGIKPVIPD